MTEFEELISEDQHLSKLLNNKEITVFSNFSRNSYSAELKSYIEEKYHNIFVELYRKGIENNEKGVVNALIRSSEFLATEKTKSAIAKEFDGILELAHNNILAFKTSLAVGSKEVHFGAKLDDPIDGLIINIFNLFDSLGNVPEYKNKIITAGLDICDMVANVNPQKEPFKYAVHNAVLNNFAQIKDLGALKERFSNQQVQITKKHNRIEVKYFVLAFIVIIILVLRFLSRMDRMG